MTTRQRLVRGGIALVGVIAVAVIAYLSLVHQLRPTGKSVARGPSQVAFINLTEGDEQGASGDLYLLDVDRGEVTQLTAGGQVMASQWTPDGEEIYLRARGTATDRFTYKLNVGTGRLTTLADSGVSAMVWLDGSISPDGKHVLYATGESLWRASMGDIMVASRDGSSPRKVGAGSSPGWSADGQRIIYSAQAKGGADGDIYTMAADGSDPQRVAGLPGDDVMPTWSPGPGGDGGVVVFTNIIRDPAFGGATGGQVYRVDLAGGEPVLLLDGEQPFWEKFASNGQAVVVAGAIRTCLVPIDGSEESCRDFVQADLSPDGRRLIMAMRGDLLPDGSGLRSQRLCVVDIEGTKLVDGPCGFESPGGIFYPAWRPG